MEESELQAIRQARLRELQAGTASGSETKSSEDEGDKKRQLEETRQTMLAQILDNEARERLARISLVKVDKARSVEDLLIRMAQTGQLRGKVSESQLIDLLEQINQQQKPEKKITIKMTTIEQLLTKAERQLEVAEKELKECKEKLKESENMLQDALVVGFNKEKDNRLIEEKKWEEQVIKLQDALIVDFNKEKEQKRKTEKLPDGIEREGERLSIENRNFKFLRIGQKRIPRPPPIVLYHPVFANFVNDCETIDLEFNSHIMVTEFTHEMSATYDNRSYRRDKFRKLVNKHLGFILNLGVISTNNEDYSTDGCIFQGNNVSVILVVNNDEAGNTFRQASSHLRIAGAFYEDRNYNYYYLIESLTEISLDRFESTEPKRTQIIGRILLALKKAVQSLKEYYDSPNQTVPSEFPYVTSFKLFDSECEIRFKYEKRLTNNNFIYIVKTVVNDFCNIPEFLIVKFVTRYGLEMHQICANKGIAPMIYGYEKINCDWKMVIMEYLSDYKSLKKLSADYIGYTKFPKPLEPPLETDQKMRLQEKINDVVKEIHSEGFVHGNLRAKNIFYKKEEENSRDDNIKVKIVDFVFGGKENETNYPPYLDPYILWPCGVSINNPIKKIHDEELLQSTIEHCLKV
ncbi:7483_t:CDS:10 [Diversispora eburnea]|uniref:7483_t:CDS:1 n=1 Tax=Diversispora eburnea TaxID=1213867 RepID=A0A9N8WI25_9GLOM|nr:7483_t:CDS:10 [Diversispora eburnea]